VLFLLSSSAQAADDDEFKAVPKGILLPAKVEKNANAPVGGGTVMEAMTLEDIMNAYRQGKYDLAVKYFTPLAKNGHHQAEEMLGIMLRKGTGIEKDPEQAVQWLTRAADAGRPLAAHHLAICYYSGAGVVPDKTKALMWIYIALAHYTNGAEKDRALKDRDNIYAELTRRDRARAEELARSWLEKRNESGLLDLNQAVIQPTK